MRFRQIESRRYAQFERLAAVPGLTHAFSTRPEDVSARTDARAAERAAARSQFVCDFGFDPARLTHTVQSHEPNLVHVIAQTAGRLENVDGLYTTEPQKPLMTFSADCPLVLVYDPARRALGMAHASWRCTVACITGRLIERMRAELGARPEECLAGVGPSAGPEAYEVREDVYEAAHALPDRDSLFAHREGRMFFNLWEANRRQMISSGLRPSNIEIAGYCTMSHTDIFFSFRREGAGCGHFGLLAGLSA